MMLTIKCPSCETEGKMSVMDPDFQGPYRCWKCRELFQLTIANNQVKACEPISPEELEKQQAEMEKQQELEALKAKFKK